MSEATAGFIFGLIAAFFIGLSILLVINRTWEKDAIKHGHATYELVASNSTEVIFKWK